MHARDIDVGSGSIKGSAQYNMFYGMSPDGKTTLEEYHGRRSAMLMRRVDAAILTFHNSMVRAIKAVSAAGHDLAESQFAQRAMGRLTRNEQSAEIATQSIESTVDKMAARAVHAKVEGQDMPSGPRR